MALLWAGRSSAVTDGEVTKPAAQTLEYSEAIQLESGDVTSERRSRTSQSSGLLLQPAIGRMPAAKIACRRITAVGPRNPRSLAPNDPGGSRGQ